MSAPGRDGAALVDVRGLKVRYGVIEALHGVDVMVRRGEIVTVIGANGAGKTTLLKAISGLVPAAEGTIRFDDDRDLSRPQAANPAVDVLRRRDEMHLRAVRDGLVPLADVLNIQQVGDEPFMGVESIPFLAP